MCLILFAYKTHPEYKLILAANRDEFYERPTGEAHWRGTAPDILAGIDHHAGGTWMGISRCGRFVALTNYRNPADMLPHKASRGKLVNDFLTGGLHPASYSCTLSESADQYNGYNLLFGCVDELFYYSNKTKETLRIGAGLYGLSNHLLDTPWAKVERGKSLLDETISGNFTHDDLLDILTDSTHPPDEALPDTGVGIEKERLLSPIFIQSETYGTRCSTIITISQRNEVSFTERTYTKGNQSDVTYRFCI